MEGNEIEMTKEELQRWIRRKVKKNKLIVAEVEKCNLLRSLLKRRENQAIHLRQLRSSVAACETLVKKYYSLLGWEYQDTCSDDEMSTTNGEKIPPSTYETHNHGFSSTNGPTPPSLNGKTFHRLRVPTQKMKKFITWTQWEPDEDSSDSDFSSTNDKPWSKKRRKN